MNLTGALAASGLALVCAAWLGYLSQIPKGRAPRPPILVLLVMATGVGLGGAAVSTAVGPDAAVFLSALFAAVVATAFVGLFLFMLRQMPLPRGEVAFSIGERIPVFGAYDSGGNLIKADDWLGKRTLIKFFRGSWCPYSRADLQHLEAMRARLLRRGVRMVAISRDSVSEGAALRKRDALGFTMLADPELSVTRTFGLLQKNGLQFATWTVLGIQLAVPTSYAPMALPTLILLDEEGVVRWIDQAKDVRDRSDESAITHAIERAGRDAPPVG